jgi:hypothetical protein
VAGAEGHRRESGILRLGARAHLGYNAGMTATAEKTHFVPRPLPEPERSKHVSAIGQPPSDALGKLLEQWLKELRGGYTIAGD